MSPLRIWVRSHLHRKLFVTFGMVILVCSVSTVGVMVLMNQVMPSPWTQEMERGRHFLGNQFAERWDDPGARDALMFSIQQDLGFDVTLKDRQGAVVASTGSCAGKHCMWFHSDVVRGGEVLGQVTLCGTRTHEGAWIRLLLPLLFIGVILWGASLRLARMLARPLVDVARVAQDIGSGRLASRMKLGCHEPGEIGRLADAINDMASKIERQMADQRELLAAVSHELRTPLARLRILAELARHSADGKTLDEIDREVVELDALVGDLLANSRLEFTALSMRPLKARELASRALERANLEPALLTDEAPNATVECDATLIQRALANIIENARAHGKGLKTLRIRTREGFVAFEAEDAGDGFAPGEEARVFEKFVYSDKTPGKDRLSLGLGLALVRRIAEAHGGGAYAQNRSGGGARVGFEVATVHAEMNAAV